ncbi:hypothetical protein LLS1_34330 [Leifsonia sp. LS1]|uniref:HdeD family acid-resistance protein n=1 Tax=unclassified Leifsonia TaxID=2663824 RepID=UPI001CBFB63A|nr:MULTISPECIES: DUF308 domain-containing protein [unclassified Leifsonia]UAJ77826.1 DUF308 domain-containing protein [Leifsonia sp. ZF2019]GIT81764.1 hypothetical protein LLS1_34330 [Leifsonia sp. LS1]
MSTTDPVDAVLHDFSLDAKNLTRSAINGIRATLGISGAVAVILGVVLLFWPVKTIEVVAIFLGIYFLVAGIMRIGIGIFSTGISGGLRTLSILLGVLLVVAGVVAVKNVSTAATVLVIFAIAFVGVGWIIEGVMALAESGRTPNSGWAIAFGILSILAGIVVLVLPASSAAFLLLFAAIALIVLGAIGIVRAFTFGRDVLAAAK